MATVTKFEIETMGNQIIARATYSDGSIEDFLKMDRVNEGIKKMVALNGKSFGDLVLARVVSATEKALEKIDFDFSTGSIRKKGTPLPSSSPIPNTPAPTVSGSPSPSPSQSQTPTGSQSGSPSPSATKKPNIFKRAGNKVVSNFKAHPRVWATIAVTSTLAAGILSGVISANITNSYNNNNNGRRSQGGGTRTGYTTNFTGADSGYNPLQTSATSALNGYVDFIFENPDVYNSLSPQDQLGYIDEACNALANVGSDYTYSVGGNVHTQSSLSVALANERAAVNQMISELGGMGR